jgi:hypothetical protein
MLPSLATERRTSKNVGPGPQLMSCEAQRDLVSRARVNLLNQRQNQRNRPARPPNRNFETPHPPPAKRRNVGRATALEIVVVLRRCRVLAERRHA